MLRGTNPVGAESWALWRRSPRGRGRGRSWVVRVVPPEREAPAGNGRPGEGLEGEERALNAVLKQRELDASATRCRRFLLHGARRPGPSSPRLLLSRPSPQELSDVKRRLRRTRRPLQPRGGEGGGTKPAALRGNPAGAEGRGSRRASHARGLLTGWPRGLRWTVPGAGARAPRGRGVQTWGRGVRVRRREVGSRAPQSGRRLTRASPAPPARAWVCKILFCREPC